MSIRDASGLPDDQVPDWVRESRERKRERVESDYQRAINKEIDKAKERLALLEAAKNNHMLFSVTTSFEDHHSGRDITMEKKIWARDAAEAEYSATHNHEGIAYCHIIGWTTLERGIPILKRGLTDVESCVVE